MKKILVVLAVFFCIQISYSQGTWKPLGPDTYDFGSYAIHEFGEDKIHYVVYAESTRPTRLVVKKLINGKWLSLGSDFLTNSNTIPSLIKANSNGDVGVIYYDYDKRGTFLQIYNGINWIEIPTESGSQFNLVFDKNRIPIISYVNDLGFIQVKKFINNKWESLGGDFPKLDPQDSFSFLVDKEGRLIIIYTDVKYNYDSYGNIESQVNMVSAKKYVDNKWEYIGNRQFIEASSNYKINAIIDNQNKIYALVGSEYQKKRLLHFENNQWNDFIINDEILDAASGVKIDSQNNIYVFSSKAIKKFQNKIGSYIEKEFTNGQKIYNFHFDNNDIPIAIFKGSNDYILKKKVGDFWEIIGESIAKDWATNEIFIVNNNIPYVLYRDSALGGKLVLKKYENNLWNLVGKEVINEGDLIFDPWSSYRLFFDKYDKPCIFYTEARGENRYDVVKRFDNLNWKTLDEIVNASRSMKYQYAFNNTNKLYRCSNSTNYLEIFDTDSNLLFHKMMIGTGEIPRVYFDELNNFYVAHYATTRVYIKRFSSVDKKPIKFGDEFSVTFSYTSGSPNFKIINSSDIYIAYVKTYGKTIVQNFNGAEWITLGEEGLANNTKNYYSIQIGQGKEVFAFNTENEFQKFDGNNWNIITGQQGFMVDQTSFYNSKPVSLNVDSGRLYFKYFDENATNLAINDYNSYEDKPLELGYFPNPVKEVLYLNKDYSTVSIYDYLGRLVKSLRVINNSIDMSDISLGNYILKLESDNKFEIIKVVKN